MKQFRDCEAIIPDDAGADRRPVAFSGGEAGSVPGHEHNCRGYWMRSRCVSILVLLTVAGFAACAGSAYLPGEPGSPSSDISGRDVRSQWLLDHPDVDDEVRTAIEEGVFIAGMTIEQRDVVTNPDRRGTMGDGYWRSREVGIDVRYQWFVGGTKEPFQDGLGRKVCELVYVRDRLREVRYCGLAPDSSE